MGFENTNAGTDVGVSSNIMIPQYKWPRTFIVQHSSTRMPEDGPSWKSIGHRRLDLFKIWGDRSSMAALVDVQLDLKSYSGVLQELSLLMPQFIECGFRM